MNKQKSEFEEIYLSQETFSSKIPTSLSSVRRFCVCCPIIGTLEAIATTDAMQHNRSARPASSCNLS